MIITYDKEKEKFKSELKVKAKKNKGLVSFHGDNFTVSLDHEQCRDGENDLPVVFKGKILNEEEGGIGKSNADKSAADSLARPSKNNELSRHSSRAEISEAKSKSEQAMETENENTSKTTVVKGHFSNGAYYNILVILLPVLIIARLIISIVQYNRNNIIMCIAAAVIVAAVAVFVNIRGRKGRNQIMKILKL